MFINISIINALPSNLFQQVLHWDAANRKKGEKETTTIAPTRARAQNSATSAAARGTNVSSSTYPSVFLTTVRLQFLGNSLPAFLIQPRIVSAVAPYFLPSSLGETRVSRHSATISSFSSWLKTRLFCLPTKGGSLEAEYASLEISRLYIIGTISCEES